MAKSIIGVTVGTPMKPNVLFERTPQAEQINKNAEDIRKLFNDLAELRYKPIEIRNSVSTAEMGSVVNEVTISWTLHEAIKSQKLDGDVVDVAARSKTLTNISVKQNRTFQLEVEYERGATDSASTSIAFVNGVYYGVLESGAEIDSTAIKTMTRKLQTAKGITFTVNAGATQKIVYALPTKYGTPGFNVGGFDGGFSLVKTFDFTNASGHTESYAVWMSDNVGLGSTTVKVS